jgi:hypothetical protein
LNPQIIIQAFCRIKRLKSVPWLRGSKIEGRRGSCWGSVPHLL